MPPTQQPEQQETKFLTPAEVGQILRLTPWQVVNLCRSGKLRATKPFGQWRIAQADLNDAIERGYEKPAETATSSDENVA